jgi:hypothetical protein
MWTSPKRTSFSKNDSPVEHEKAKAAPVFDLEAGCVGKVIRQTPSVSVTADTPPKLVDLTAVPGSAKPKTIALAGARCNTMWSLKTLDRLHAEEHDASSASEKPSLSRMTLGDMSIKALKAFIV